MSVNRNNIINKIKPAGSTGAEYTIAPTIMVDNSTNYTASLPTLTEDSKLLLSAVSVTYAQLAVLISNNQLLAGSFYRITDFVTTTAQARTQSAGHQFDLIVHAISNNELSEDASACLHAGDSYFANSNLKAWVLKYSFANDTSRFAWADTTNGKGVIYYMRDEFYNECSYDFKNIQFARYKVASCANVAALVGCYCGIIHHTSGNAVLTDFMTIDTTDYKYFYTFDLYGTDNSLNPIGKTFTRSDGSTFVVNQIQCTKCLICADENDSSKYYLNNFVCMLDASKDCMFRITGWCQNVTFLGGVGITDFNSVYNSIVGSVPSPSFIEGYVATSSSINTIAESLVCTTGTNYAFRLAAVTHLAYSCLYSKGTCIQQAYVNYIGSCVLTTTGNGSMIIRQSTVGTVGGSTISCTNCVIYSSTIDLIGDCTGSGATFYCTNVNGNILSNVTMYDLSLNDTFISYSTFNRILASTISRLRGCKANDLQNVNLRVVSGCTFGASRYLTCTQNLDGCNFGPFGVDFLTISSSNTSQTIKNTNIHDIAGTDSDHIKNVVIPEDYTNPHTVEIYSSEQYRIYEID